MDAFILLGRVQNPQHEQRLLDVAHWLDQNKFSCTMSIVNGLAQYDITSNQDWHNDEKFTEYALELVIAALSRKLSE